MNNITSSCPVHNDNKNCSVFWEFEFNNTPYSLYKCSSCDLLFYNPLPTINYETHTNSIISIKDYVHLNSNISGLLSILLNYIPANANSSMMEIGCGFGFTLDFANHMLGMEVVGFEPSLYGEMGSRELNVNIKRTYLTSEDTFERKFDIIFISEVIEHIHNPADFIRLLKKNLSETGVLIVTTPNYKKLRKNLNHPSELAMLSPGAHTILFSAKSLQKILKDAGLEFIQITETENLVTVCSNRPVQFKVFENKAELIIKYYQSVLKRVKPDALVYTGIVCRLLKEYIDSENYGEAAELLKDYPLPELPSLESIVEINRLEEFYEPGPICSSLLFYYYGLLSLNYYFNYTTAAFYFLSGFLLCKKKLAIIPHYSVLEVSVVWTAKYYQALALYMAGSYTEALKECNKIIEFRHNVSNQFMPIPDKHILEMATKLSDQIKHTHMAGQVDNGGEGYKKANEIQNWRAGDGYKKSYEIQNWYNKEYEVLPLWYKRVGHIIKILSGRRSLFKKSDHK